MYAFGSAVNGNSKPETSDLDLYVELEEMLPLERDENLISLWEALDKSFREKGRFDNRPTNA